MQHFADVVFTGGAVFTGRGLPLGDHAVAVTDGRITAVVPSAEIDALVGAHTEVVDLQGGLLSPGFQDSHVHPTSGGVELLQCHLGGANGAEDAVRLIADYAEANPGLPWILGGGWSMDHFPGGAPSRHLIDAVVPDRPVALFSRDHHSLWANTAALRAAGIDTGTPDPADGFIELDADGNPTGTLHEGAAELVHAVSPATGDELTYQGLLRGQEELLALGITGWQDAIVGNFGSIKNIGAAYERAVREGRLLARVRGAIWWQRDRGLEQVPEILEVRAVAAELGVPERYALGSVKIMVDGIAENQTAAMKSAYRDCHGHDTGNTGLSFIDAAKLREYVAVLDAAGFQVHFHALGDRAVQEALDAVEAALEANGPTGLRHHLAHLQIVAKDDAERFADLGAVANLQPLWACHEDQLDELTLPFMPEGAESRHYPFGDLHRAGARLAAGSDWPVSSADPLQGMHVAVNRIAPGSARGPLGGAGQRLDLATAFAAYTSGAAYVNHREQDTGSIAPGYLADLAVVRPNPFALDPAHIHTCTVESTWIDGRRVYAAQDDPALEGA